jgi:hypothetical protein
MNWTFNVSLTEGSEPPINLAIFAKNISSTWDNTGNVYYNSTSALNVEYMEGIAE